MRSIFHRRPCEPSPSLLQEWGALVMRALLLQEHEGRGCIVLKKSKYFTHTANCSTGPGGDESVGKILFREQCFDGEGRQVHIFVFLTGEKPFVLGQPGRKFVDGALGKSGVLVQWYHDLNPRALATALSQITQDPRKNTIWIISGCNKHQITDESAKQIAEFHRRGGGLALWGDNEPFFEEANRMMKVLNWGEMLGNYIGGQVIGPAHNAGEPGFNASHPILYGVHKLYEGSTICSVPDGLLREGWMEIMRASDKRLLTAYLPPSRTGAVVLHGAFTQLFCSLGSQGQEIFVTNLGTYTVLRMDDVNDHQSLKREKLDGKGAPACCWIASAFMIAMMRNSRGS